MPEDKARSNEYLEATGRFSPKGQTYVPPPNNGYVAYLHAMNRIACNQPLLTFFASNCKIHVISDSMTTTNLSSPQHQLRVMCPWLLLITTKLLHLFGTTDRMLSCNIKECKELACSNWLCYKESLPFFRFT